MDYHRPLSKLQNKSGVSIVLWKEHWLQNGETIGSRRKIRGEDVNDAETEREKNHWIAGKKKSSGSLGPFLPVSVSSVTE